MKIRFRVPVLVLIAPLTCGYSFAQDGVTEKNKNISSSIFSSENILEEVIVTAQKRTQSVQEIPIAIDAYTGDKIVDSGLADFDDLSQVSTSFNINTASGSAQPFIRGIGSNVSGTGTYGSVSVYIDGAYIPRGYSLASGAGSLDYLESLQVLKGPQGSLYGRNATGGSIVITTHTAKPEDEFYGSLRATVGDFGVRKYSLEIGGGITDTLAAQLAYSQHDSDGFIENLSGPDDLDDQDGFQYRGKLVFAPTEDIEFVLSASYNEDLQETLAFQQVGQFDTFAASGPEFGGSGLNNPQVFYANTLLAFVEGGAFAGFLQANPGDFAGAGAAGAAARAATLPGAIALASGLRFPTEVGTTFNNQISGQSIGVINDSRNEDLTAGGYYEDTFITLNGKFSFDTFDLVTNTAYNDHVDSTSAEILRADPASIPDLAAAGFPFPGSANIGFSGLFISDAIAQEVYVVSKESDIDWIAGLYYFHEEGETIVSGGGFGVSQVVADNDWEVDSISIFGEATYPFTDALSLTVGGRYTDEEYTLDDFFDSNPFVPGDQTEGNLERTDSQLTYNVKLSYNVESLLLYIGTSTGFKSGALNTTNASAGAVSPEEIESYEAGFKADLVGGRVRVNGSLFYYDYDNIQLNILQPANNVTFLVDDVQAEIIGLELGVEALVNDYTNVFASTTVLDHEYTSDATIPQTANAPLLTQDIDGNDLAQTSDLVIVVGVDHNIPLDSGAQLRLNTSVNYNSGFYINQTNDFGSTGDDDGSYVTANANIKYLGVDDRWSVALFVNNLTDEEYFRGGLDSGGASQVATAGRPRHWGLTGEIKF